jgi:ParB-like chromosome segregation protein Spo0J
MGCLVAARQIEPVTTMVNKMKNETTEVNALARMEESEMAGEADTLTNDSKVAGQVMPVPQIDPEFKALMCPLNQDEIDGLKESIKAEGLRDRLIVWKEHNILLDGHHRYEICQELGIAPKIREIDQPDRVSAKIWVLNNQRSRRNLDESQRAMLAVDLEKLYAEQAKSRTGSRTDLGQNVDQGKGEFGRSAEKAGKAMDVSHASVSYAKKVVNEGISELGQMVKARELSVSAAAKVATLPQDVQKTVIENVETQLQEGKKPHVAAIIRDISPIDKIETKPAEDKLDKGIKQLKAALDEVSQIPNPKDAIAKIDDLISYLEAKRDRLSSLEAVKEHLQNKEILASPAGISVGQSQLDADIMEAEA